MCRVMQISLNVLLKELTISKQTGEDESKRASNNHKEAAETHSPFQSVDAVWIYVS